MNPVPMTHSANIPPTAASTSATGRGGATNFSALHPDIIKTHILTRLDGAALASTACSSVTLRHLSSQDNLWFHACHATWPSTSNPRVSHVVSTVPEGGPRAFFALSYPLPPLEPTSSNLGRGSQPSELVSAVDIRYENELIFTKVQETETVSGWFRCSPFRIDLLGPKDVVPTPIKFPVGDDDTCEALMNDMTLSWIVVDPSQRLAVNLSSHKPVSVQRHWLTGEVQAKFASIQMGPTSGHVQLGIVVTCGGSEEGETQIKEVSLEVEDIDGRHLNGKDSLVILQRALEGKRGKGVNRVEESRRRYQEFLHLKKRRKEKKLKTEGALDILCVAFVVLLGFVAFWCFILRK